MASESFVSTRIAGFIGPSEPEYWELIGLDTRLPINLIDRAYLASMYSHTATGLEVGPTRPKCDHTMMVLLIQARISVTLAVIGGTLKLDMTFVVVDDLAVPAVLGNDFVESYGAVMDCHDTICFTRWGGAVAHVYHYGKDIMNVFVDHLIY